MTAAPEFSISQLSAGDVSQMHELLTVFATEFAEPETYTSARPDDAHLEQLLSADQLVVLVAIADDVVMGGLVAYELPKFEQNRSELYIYDLAVGTEFRRRGVATALIRKVQAIAASRNVHVIFVQADQGDTPAIKLYSKLGTREDVHHFDIAVR